MPHKLPIPKTVYVRLKKIKRHPTARSGKFKILERTPKNHWKKIAEFDNEDDAIDALEKRYFEIKANMSSVTV